ncbi:MAG: diguanylate cyclase [Cyanobium sp.]
MPAALPSVPSLLKGSSRLLRDLLLAHWLGSTLLLTAILATIDLFDHRWQVQREVDLAAHIVESVLRTPMPDINRQQLLEAYDQSTRVHQADVVNVLMVLDRSGRILYSSRPTWRSLNIDDPLFSQMGNDDPAFATMLRCFRSSDADDDCTSGNHSRWQLHLSGYTDVRAVSLPGNDLGLPRRSFLVVVNFDTGMLIADFLQDLPPLLLLSALLSLLLCIVLWLLISTRLLPQVVETSQTDSLTNLMNRTSFMELAMDVLAEAEERQADLVFAILDIDHFKRINDTYGHGCGDAALASVGSLLLTVTRPEDLVCRFGGEEFAMLLSTGRQSGTKVLERLRLQLEMNRVSYRGHKLPITVSIGAAATHECGFNLDFLYNSADKALYAAKHGGRNRLEWNSGKLLSSRLPLSPVKGS